ncbi:Ribose ABC transporter, ATP-binding protein [Agrobacterium tumefaciens str. Kerr 14]|uniref:Ribose ABC transporter, ATP-binding protein n=1 Tax=Agrobacterium tumefaciens str. Kerr 14 TaxID=1183424 RepID=A0A1S7SA76_AGRTU|nr:sugar ABC transporter ATP-binding protein [Agrobacterium tumefaciens]CUX65242.1 Ribose ABC transporter, ATP-binding protein [Agrobacterium tumefaciens str. Kerr 14]
MIDVLKIANVSKSYPGVQALSNVSVNLQANEVLGLIGQNGSGKSTLLKIMAGLEQPDEGHVVLRGQRVAIRSPLEAARLGIGMVYQEQSLITNLTVAENIFFDKPNAARKWGLYNWTKLNEAARMQLQKLDSHIPPDVVVEKLSFSDRQTVEFAKVLAVEEMIDEQLVILFDEPTSLLSSSEVDSLFTQITRLKERASVVFISHRMDEVLEISDRVHVMSNGISVAERTPGSTDHEELYSLMVGKKRAADYFLEEQRRPVPVDKVVLKVDGLNCPDCFRDVSLRAHKGEIVGITGVAGSGAEEVLRAIFGAEEGVTGEMVLNGLRRSVAAGPGSAIMRGIGYVPSERKAEGVIAGRTIMDNVVLTFGPEFGRRGLIDSRVEQWRALKLIAQLKTKAPSVAEYVERLSGGNQQKVSLAKWLMADRLQLLLLDHPTRGLDPGAKTDVFEAMRKLASGGLAIIFVADTLEETLGMADTVIVMRDGEISARFDNLYESKPAPELIVKAMV